MEHRGPVEGVNRGFSGNGDSFHQGSLSMRGGAFEGGMNSRLRGLNIRVVLRYGEAPGTVR